jgi:hypothetical protein
MICEACHGTGNVSTRFDPYDGVWVDFPCQTCGGSGRDYCCGGSERYGQLDGESTGRDPSAASKTDGAARHSDQDGGSPPIEDQWLENAANQDAVISASEVEFFEELRRLRQQGTY